MSRMNKIILLAIIGIIAVSCTSKTGDGMFEDVPVSFDTDDANLLHLAVAVKADEYLVIGARGGFMPNTYYTILKELAQKEQMPIVDYTAIQKESEDDPGKIIWALYSDSNRAYIIDSTGAFIALPGEVNFSSGPSDSLKAIRDRDYPDARIKPLSAFNVIAKDLATIRMRFAKIPDNDWIVLILEEHLNRDHLYELIPLMYAIKKVGFKHIQIGRNLGNLDTARSVTGTYRLYDFEKDELQGLYDELYRPMNMKMPRQVPKKR